MKSGALLFAFLLVPIPGAPASLAAAPDVIPAGTHIVEYSLTIDAGPFAANQCRRCTVVAGDTLEAIAKRECGDASCVEEIRLLNTPATTAKLEAGASLIIPPRAAASDSRAASRPEAGAATQWVFFHKIGSGFRPILANEALGQSNLMGPGFVVAVARDKIGWLLRDEWKNFDSTEGAAISDALPYTRVVKQSDPTSRIEASAVIKGVKDGRIVVEVTQKKFDKNGKLIGRGTPRRGDLSTAMMLVTAAAALLAMVRLAVRRRRTARQAG